MVGIYWHNAESLASAPPSEAVCNTGVHKIVRLRRAPGVLEAARQPQRGSFIWFCHGEDICFSPVGRVCCSVRALSLSLQCLGIAGDNRRHRVSRPE